MENVKAVDNNLERQLAAEQIGVLLAKPYRPGEDLALDGHSYHIIKTPLGGDIIVYTIEPTKLNGGNI